MLKLKPAKLAYAVMIGLGCLLTGCASKPSLYYWGDYEDNLDARYIQNDPNNAYTGLQTIMLEAEQQHLKIPPGMNADYGFMLYSRGDKDGAVKYFQLEKSLYPEATALMDKLIERVNQQQKPPDTTLTPPAPAPTPAAPEVKP